ncbi:MAG: DNA polymerase III subunit delta [Xanthomonadales bacterium]|nr:DNA polymerase III subunit delta [Xanthomonadales bacterium]
MRLSPDRLAGDLEQGLKPAYLISGDEPLLVLEAAEQVRQAARAAGIEERQVHHAGKGFDYQDLLTQSQSMSLFSTRRLIDLRLPEPKPGREGSQVIKALLEDPGNEDVLLLTTGKADKRTLASAWASAIDQAGVVIQCWPIKPQELPRWLDRRMRSAGLLPDSGAVHRLAERVEGNLLAAVQEIEKLKLLRGAVSVTAGDIEELVADSARFGVFLMVDSALEGRPDRALRMVESLRQEDIPLPIVSAVLTREIRRLVRLRQAMDRGGNVQAEFRRAGVWESKKMLLQRAMRRISPDRWLELLNRCAVLDRSIKGLDPHDPWHVVEDLARSLAAGR